ALTADAEDDQQEDVDGEAAQDRIHGCTSGIEELADVQSGTVPDADLATRSPWLLRFEHEADGARGAGATEREHEGDAVITDHRGLGLRLDGLDLETIEIRGADPDPQLPIVGPRA